MNEEWRPVEGWPYEVSDLGRVRNRRRRVLRPYLSRDGYECITLCCEMGRSHRGVHQLVGVAFLGAPPTPEHQINHRNGVKRHNWSSNLEWVTCRENIAHAIATGLRRAGENHAPAKITDEQAREIYRRANAGESGAALGREYGICRAGVSRLKRGIIWRVATGAP